jgi:hypothetical protein
VQPVTVDIKSVKRQVPTWVATAVLDVLLLGGAAFVLQARKSAPPRVGVSFCESTRSGDGGSRDLAPSSLVDGTNT